VRNEFFEFCIVFTQKACYDTYKFTVAILKSGDGETIFLEMGNCEGTEQLQKWGKLYGKKEQL
jgi:hypothetical protein